MSVRAAALATYVGDDRYLGVCETLLRAAIDESAATKEEFWPWSVINFIDTRLRSVDRSLMPWFPSFAFAATLLCNSEHIAICWAGDFQFYLFREGRVTAISGRHEHGVDANGVSIDMEVRELSEELGISSRWVGVDGVPSEQLIWPVVPPYTVVLVSSRTPWSNQQSIEAALTTNNVTQLGGLISDVGGLLLGIDVELKADEGYAKGTLT